MQSFQCFGFFLRDMQSLPTPLRGFHNRLAWSCPHVCLRTVGGPPTDVLGSVCQHTKTRCVPGNLGRTSRLFTTKHGGWLVVHIHVYCGCYGTARCILGNVFAVNMAFVTCTRVCLGFLVCAQEFWRTSDHSFHSSFPVQSALGWARKVLQHVFFSSTTFQTRASVLEVIHWHWWRRHAWTIHDGLCQSQKGYFVIEHFHVHVLPMK